MGLNMGHLGLRHALARLRGTQLEKGRLQAKHQARLDALQPRLDKLQATVNECRAQLAAANLESETIADEIKNLESALRVVFADTANDIGSRQTFPKKHITGWGNLTRTILQIFKNADGGPLSATQVTTQLRIELALSELAPEVAKGLRRQVGRTLQNMHHAGYLQRLHAPVTRQEGVWHIKVSSE